MSDQKTTDNFWAVMADYVPPETKPIPYRLYYNDDGTPNCYTMDNLPGNYIEVDRETYIANLWNVCVIDNQLIIIPPKVTVRQLQQTSEGTSCDIHDVSIVVSESQPHIKWSIGINETSA